MARYDETESRWLLPLFMRRDAFDSAMSEIIDEFGADVSAATRDYSIWDVIDGLDEAALDALADELNILWYDKTADLDVKRGIVRNCKHIQAKLGTKWSLESILDIYFSAHTVITEWFEYGGEPNHFRVETEFDTSTAEGAARFLAVLNQVKRKSAVLDKIVAVIGGDCCAESAVWAQCRRVERVDVRR